MTETKTEQKTKNLISGISEELKFNKQNQINKSKWHKKINLKCTCLEIFTHMYDITYEVLLDVGKNMENESLNEKFNSCLSSFTSFTEDYSRKKKYSELEKEKFQILTLEKINSMVFNTKENEIESKRAKLLRIVKLFQLEISTVISTFIY